MRHAGSHDRQTHTDVDRADRIEAVDAGRLPERGLGPRDVTPQATALELDYQVPGLGEEMRRAGLASTPMSMLSRGLAGVRGRTLVLNLPGSERGATESLSAVVPALGHALELLRGRTRH